MPRWLRRSDCSGRRHLGQPEDYINSDTALGVTAGDVTGGKLTLASTSATHPSLNVSSNLVDNSIAAGPAALNYTATAAYSDGLTTAPSPHRHHRQHDGADNSSDLLQLGTQAVERIATISYSDKAGQSLTAATCPARAMRRRR